MSAPAAIQGDYVDLRFIKGRKVCQIVIEIPIEAGATFVAAFGTPNPATGIPVAMARIDPNAAPERKGGKLAMKAGILCENRAFCTFIGERLGTKEQASSDRAAEYIRELCQISSRAELDHDLGAAQKFKDLETSYRAWLTVSV